MELLLLGWEKLVCDLYDWIVVSEWVWVLVTTELKRNEDFCWMLNLLHENLLDQLLLLNKRFDVEDVSDVSNTKHKFDLEEFGIKNIFIVFVVDHYSW